MIKTKKEKFLIGIIGITATIISYYFTISMLMTFGETAQEKFLYMLCGVIIDGVKWFSLITAIKYYRAGIYSSLVMYLVLFILFLCVSVVASVSYSIYGVKKQMYDTSITENNAYVLALQKTNDLKANLDQLKAEKTSEIKRLNDEKDLMPLDWISRRNEIEDRKLEINTTFDKQINDRQWQYNEQLKVLEGIDNKPIETKTLKNNAMAGFFQTISNVLKVDIDNIIVWSAIILGVLLDVASVAMAFDNAFSYDSKRSFNKDLTRFKNIKVMQPAKKNNVIELSSYDKFKQYIIDNNIEISKVTDKDFQSYMSRATFFNYKKQLLEENKMSAELKTAVE